jgi:hypothetical protein
MKAHNRRIPLLLSAVWALVAIATFVNWAQTGFPEPAPIILGGSFLALCVICLLLALRP